MRKLFFDIDTQNYFFDSDLLEQEKRNTRELTEFAVKKQYRVVGSVESHDFTSWAFYTNPNKSSIGEKRYKPPFCIRGTYDWLKFGTLPEKTIIVPDVNYGLFGFTDMMKRPEYSFVQAVYFEKQINLGSCHCFNSWMYQEVQTPILQTGDEVEFILYGASEGIFEWLPDLLEWVENVKQRKSEVKLNIVLVKDAFNTSQSKVEQDLCKKFSLETEEQLKEWLATNNVQFKSCSEITGKQPVKSKPKKQFGVVPIV